MKIFKCESDLVQTLRNKKKLVYEVIESKITIDEFFREYEDFYTYYALDGHESDVEERELFEKYSEEINFFRIIENNIFNKICSDEDANKEIYRLNNRISKKEAIRELSEILQED